MDGEPSLRNRVVLLVQPERDDREMYEEFLRGAGLNVIAVDNAVTALGFAARADAIVTGILLTGEMDGIALIERIRTDRTLRSKPVIVLSACAYMEDRNRALAAGCDVFLAKPCVPPDLLRRLRLLLVDGRDRVPPKAGLRAGDRRRTRTAR
jgi:CheY-like chemotaxis protein